VFVRSRLSIFVACLAVSGCVSAPPERLERDVRHLVRMQVPADSTWRRDGAADARTRERLTELVADGVTAEEAVQIAFIASPDLQLEFETLGVARAEYLDALRVPNPLLHAKRRGVRGGPGRNEELGIVQDLLALLTLPARRRGASLALEAARLETAARVVSAAAQTQADFYRLLAARGVREQQALRADAARLAFELAERFHAAGNLTLIERERWRDRWLAAQDDLTQAHLELQAARESLGRRMGVTGIEDGWTAAGELPPLPGADPELADAEHAAIAKRLDLMAARRSVEARLAALGLERKLRLLPGLEVGYSREREPGEEVRGPEGTVELPIFDWKQAAIAASDTQARTAMRRAEALALEARHEVRTSHARLRAARARAETYRDQVIPARAAITDGEQREFFFMLKGPFEPLEAQQETYAARAALAQSLGEYWIARIELARASADPQGVTK
jgi:cobalt-zinc-cadmium efflux system outer membrane protein